MDKIKENNKLIAEFMELEFTSRMSLGKEHYGFIIPWDKNRLYPLKYLEYHESWDWLMSVIEKIEKLTNELPSCKWTQPFPDQYEVTLSSEVQSGIGDTHKKAAYKAVVEFIKWYNEQNK